MTAALRSERPAALSRELRRGGGRFLARRRQVVALSYLSTAAVGIVGLYQIGLLRHLPEPPLPRLDADRVDASTEAYAFLEVGDAFLGLVSYATTALLAAAGPADRARRRPWLPLALAAKAGFDALQSARLTRLSWRKHRAFCFWCLLAAGASFTAVPFTWPEARAALRRLRQP